MTNPKPTYEMSGDRDLSKFLLGAIRDVRKNELEVERAIAISQLADKYIKNEVSICLKAKLKKRIDAIEIQGEANQILIDQTGGE